MGKSGQEVMSILIEKDLKDEFEKISAEKERTLSQTIRLLVKAYLSDSSVRKLIEELM